MDMKKIFDKVDNTFGLAGYAAGFGCCAAASIIVFWVMFVVPLVFIAFYIILFIPFMFFSFMLNRKLITDTALRNRAASFAYKLTATLLIWFIAFFPFSWFGVTELLNIPAEVAKSREASQLREEILNSQTYADLTPFGLGIYKLVNEGDEYLWDVTKPQDRVLRHNDTLLVFSHHYNVRERNTWDNQNLWREEMYDVYLYEGTYIIIPLSKYNSVYLCKEIGEHVDLFLLGGVDSEAKEKLRELPGERYSRQEIAGKSGKDKLR